MEINRENYESWLLDYTEGNLSPGQIMAVHRFLEQHPDLKAELDAWQETVLVPDPALVFPDKEKLYRRRRIAWLPLALPLGAAAALAVFFLLLQPDRQSVSSTALVEEPQRPQAGADATAALPAERPQAGADATAALPAERPQAGADAKAALPAERPQAGADATAALPAERPQATAGIAVGSVPAPVELVAELLPQADPGSAEPARLQPVAAVPAQTLAGSARGVALDQAQALAIPAANDLDGTKGSASVPLSEALAQAIPLNFQEILATTQSAGQTLAGVLSGESSLLSSLRREPRETRVFRFSAGPFEIIHRKTTKSDV